MARAAGEYLPLHHTMIRTKLIVVNAIEQDPEEELSLGLARFALIGQLVRLHIFDEDTVARVIEEFEDQLHVGGRMRVLQTLIRYAGPLVCTVTTADALETVREACEARPCDSMMDWMYSVSSDSFIPTIIQCYSPVFHLLVTENQEGYAGTRVPRYVRGPGI